jgi:hypothetical protein
VSSELEWVNFGPTLHCCDWSRFDGAADDAQGDVLHLLEDVEVVFAGCDEDFCPILQYGAYIRDVRERRRFQQRCFSLILFQLGFQSAPFQSFFFLSKVTPR